MNSREEDYIRSFYGYFDVFFFFVELGQSIITGVNPSLHSLGFPPQTFTATFQVHEGLVFHTSKDRFWVQH